MMNNEIALLTALKEGKLEEVSALMGKADINYRDVNGNTALSLSAKHNHFEIFRLLLANRAVVSTSSEGKTCLHHFAENGNVDAAKWLVKHRVADVNEWTLGGTWNVLHLAARAGRTVVVEWLLKECGADISSKSTESMTALLYAAWKGHTDLVEVLLTKYAADIKDKDSMGQTAVLLAAVEGHVKTVRYLLTHGKANQNDSFTIMYYTKTLIFYAERNSRMMQMLLELGAMMYKSVRPASVLIDCNLAGCVVIGMRVNGKLVTRGTNLPGCELAITNLEELTEANI